MGRDLRGPVELGRRLNRVRGRLLLLPLAVVVLLLAEVVAAARAEYLPSEPGYRVHALVDPPAPAVSAVPVKLAVLGDSTAAGVGSPTVGESLPVLVAERVARALGRPVEVTGLGVSGARTGDLIDSQVRAAAGVDADVVLVVIGANDVTHVTPPWTLRAQTRALLEALRTGPPGGAGSVPAPVVLGGIPEFKTTPALAQPLRALVGAYAIPLRAVQRSVAAEAGVGFVNIARDASPRFVGRPESMSSDGFHPSPVGYGFWADALAPAVVAALDGPAGAAQRAER